MNLEQAILSQSKKVDSALETLKPEFDEASLISKQLSDCD
jgi:hypothetical protein